MMVSMETCLLRLRRKAQAWREKPGVAWLEHGVLCFGGGFLLSGARLWGQMQPLALGLILGTTGWRCVFAAAGSAVGYRILWQQEGLQGMVWTAGALLLALVLPLLETGQRLRALMAAAAACLVSGTHLAFPGRWTQADTPVLLLRMVMAAGCAGLGAEAVSGRNRGLRWMGWGCMVLSVGSLLPAVGYAAAGFAAAGAPLPGAMMAGLGADLGGAGAVSVTAAVCLACFLQRVPVEKPWAQLLAPGTACLLLMVLQRKWDLGQMVWMTAGGAVGALLPRRLPAPGRSGRGMAQVRLEQTARVLGLFQRQLLEYTPAKPDVSALVQQMKMNSCDSCSLRSDCHVQGRLDEALVQREEPFLCRRPELAMAELRRAREQLRRMKAARAAQEEYRTALVQQYGFLTDMLHGLADRLTDRPQKRARFRVQVSARSRGREIADGDRVSAFSGAECRFFVVLCDGMGTGLGAAEESRQASNLIRQMLGAGLPPETVLGSLNSQLALMNRGGAVTVDLAEVRLDSGKVWLYKWGAGPSVLLRGRKSVMVGSSGPPPGLGVGEGRENVSHVALDRQEVLLMLSDGVGTDKADRWADFAETARLGDLAQRVLADGGSREDDATVVAVRLIKQDECAPP